jgi:hypothetical protein
MERARDLVRWGSISVMLGAPPILFVGSAVVLLPDQGVSEMLAYAARALLRFGPTLAQFGLGVAFLALARSNANGRSTRVKGPGWWTLAATLGTLANTGYVLLVLGSTAPPWAAGTAYAESDLKSLAIQQELYFEEHASYSTNLEELEYVSSNGIDVTLEATPTGWSALARFTSGPTCTVYIGEVVRPPPTAWGAVPMAPGEIACDGGSRGRLESYKNLLRRIGGRAMDSSLS